MKKIKKIELLEERLVKLEKDLKGRSELLSDLLDYLMRVDANFVNHPGSFEGWYEKLMKLRLDEATRKECGRAKRTLEENGYVVVNDMNDVDAARMKKWVNTGQPLPDDDIPF